MPTILTRPVAAGPVRTVGTLWVACAVFACSDSHRAPDRVIPLTNHTVTHGQTTATDSLLKSRVHRALARIDHWKTRAAAPITATLQREDPPFRMVCIPRNPPASEAVLDRLEQDIGRTLPPGLRAFLAVCNGDTEWTDGGQGGDFFFATLDRPLQSTMQIRQAVLSGKQFGDPRQEILEYDEPYDSAQRIRYSAMYVSEGIIPFALEDGHGYAVDLNPGPHGRVGQVVWVDEGEAYFVAHDVPSMLEKYANLLEAGRFTFTVRDGLTFRSAGKRYMAWWDAE